ncbi:hypothetical protein HNR42_000954 [Deinobacterium chartae]|uniref:Uncharacterized protein n=1 Tax=Deinobacterium chartae TaxID=521158 RepID=A0A841HVX0_9DEIO|nr:hypothetical protein [Deinobacterium chartae]MBB6097537.1 hypothetical protein [Deinobacterium chartae]
MPKPPRNRSSRKPSPGKAASSPARPGKGAAKSPVGRGRSQDLSDSSATRPSSARLSSARPKGSRPQGGRSVTGPKAPDPSTVFKDRDGAAHVFPDSALKRLAAALLSERGKRWRYRAFGFPLFTQSGREQEWHFDFYVYDANEALIRLIAVVPRETPQLWDRLGLFKRQYPMYSYEIWTSERLAELYKPRNQLGF